MPQEGKKTQATDAQEDKQTQEVTTIRLDDRGRTTIEKEFRSKLPSTRYVLELRADGTIVGRPA